MKYHLMWFALGIVVESPEHSEDLKRKARPDDRRGTPK